MIFNEYPIPLNSDTLCHHMFWQDECSNVLNYQIFLKIVRHSFTSYEYIGIHLTCISRLVICIYSKWIYYAEDIREYHPPPFVIE